MSRLDFIIFGATGFTGKKAVEEAIRVSKNDQSLTWGIAGRSKSKLDNLLQDLKKKTGEDLSKVKVVIADVGDEESLKAMTSQAKVIMNCCGPYRLYGEPVIKSCIDTKTHHVDVSGEPQFMETMQLNYHKAAEDAGVYIVSACGFDSIPNDMGVVFLQQNFKGTVNSVESYLSSQIPPEYQKFGVSLIHYGTWESLVYSLANWNELPGLRKKIYPEKLPALKPKVKARSVLHNNGKNWCLPFPGADKSIVYRTQRYFYETDKQRPVQFSPYMSFPNLPGALAMLFASVILFLMSLTGFTRQLLLQYPKIFSFGTVSHEGPAEDCMNNTKFKIVLHGEGWDESVKDIQSTKPNKKMSAKVSGINPGYGATVTALVFSGLTILKENQKMPGTGGVLTTGAAFSKTNLIQTLQANNIKFEILKDEE